MPEAAASKTIMPKNLHYNSTTRESKGIKNNCSVIGNIEIANVSIFREKASY
jgi:hypothetical protein